MKNLLLLAFIISSFAACQPDAETTNNDTTATTEPAKTEQTNETAENDPANFTPNNLRSTVAKNSPIIGSPGAAISPQTQRVISALAVDYWEMAAYLRMALEKEERIKLLEENRGRWFKFSTDGTYVSGKNQEETGKGRYYYDPMGPTIYFDHADRRDEEWTVKMNSDETVMIWVGTKTFKETGIQVKMENTTDLPGAK